MVTSESRAGRWAYPGVALAALGLAAVLMRLWRADPHVPFTYHAEALYNGLLVKGTLEGGWFLDLPALGAPGTLDLRDLPTSDNNLHFLVIRLLGLVSDDWALVMNAFFLLTFPLTAASALFVFRRFGMAIGPALFGSLLYAFLPFHWSRGQHHLFLAAYALVPLAVMVMLWIAAGALGPDSRIRRGRLVGSALVCAALGSGGVYYAFFACGLFLVAGGLAALRGRSARPLLVPAALVALTFVVLLANLWPSVVHLGRHGDTPTVQRSPLDADTYGLRITQLLMPVTGHRLPWLAQAKDPLNQQLGSNEGDDASLGLVGALGFLALLIRLALPGRGERAPGERAERALGQRAERAEGSRSAVLDDLSLLNLGALLLATVGGFGLLTALTVTSKIRAYNRISVFIAFFALFAVVAGLDALDRRCRGRRLGRDAFVVGLAVVCVLALLDQTSARVVPDYARIAADYRGDRAFVRRVEAAMPAEAAIFQLPRVPFPEHPPVFRMQDYDHARGYLHSRRLRWSYGAMKGRADEAWQAWAVSRPLPELIDTLATAGFGGLYVNRDGHADWGVRVASETAAVLGQSPLVVSGDQRLFFFDLRPREARLQAAVTPAEWTARQDAARHPLLVIWQDGCSHLEGTAEYSFRWCGSAGEWRLVNRAGRARLVTVEMSFSAIHPGTLRIESPLVSERWRIGGPGRTVSVTGALSIPPGEHRLRFTCDALPVLAAGDRRHLVFRIENFRLTETASE